MRTIHKPEVKKSSMCKTHINRLVDVRNQLSYKCTMTGTQLILCEENNKKVEKAKKLIEEAMALLEEVK